MSARAWRRPVSVYVLGALNPVDRGVLLLYLDDATYADIAAITGLTESNVGVRLNRLKRAFTERYIGDPR